MRVLKLELTDQQKQELEVAVRRHPVAHLRQKAKALLLIAEGKQGKWIAQSGVVSTCRPNTIYDWVKAYQASGKLEGLSVKAGRGRKPVFFSAGSASGKTKT